MHPILFKIGPLVIHSYGALAATAFLVTSAFIFRLAKKKDVAEEIILDLLTISLIAGIIGSRLLWAGLNWSELSHWWDIFKIWKGGLIFYGGFLLALVVDILYLRRKRANIWEIADLFGVGSPLAFSVARWGCFCAGCCYGKPTDVRWGVTFTNLFSLVPPTLLNTKLHPTQIYHSVANFVTFLVLWGVLGKKKFDGEIFWLYVIFYAGGRFIIEFFRGDNPEVLFGLHSSQIIALAVIPVSIIALGKLRRAF